MNYAQIVRCDTKVWNNKYSVFTESLQEAVGRVFVWTSKGFVIVLKAKDINAFVLRLQQFAPHIQIRKLKDVNRFVCLGSSKGSRP